MYSMPDVFSESSSINIGNKHRERDYFLVPVSKKEAADLGLGHNIPHTHYSSHSRGESCKGQSDA